MNIKYFTKAALSAILFVSLALTTIIINPQVTLAGDTTNSAIELLDRGIESQEQGDLEQAESLYQEAIERVLDNGDIEILITATKGIAEIEKTQGNMDKASTIFQEVTAIENALEISIFDSRKKCCLKRPCPYNCNPGEEWRQFNGCTRCAL